MKTLYPKNEPYQRFFLETGSVHSIYVELSGNAEGKPVIFLHGGPCSGTRPDHRYFFNPEQYLIILFDQRGCGQSLPFGEIVDNTTQDLIDDMERIREHLDIKKWLLFGGSWGGALALLYAQQHQDKVSAMIIRSVFLARQQDLDWFIKSGVNRIYPESWQQLLEALLILPEDNVVEGFYRMLWGDDVQLRINAATAWEAWGAQVALGKNYPGMSQNADLTEARAHKLVLQARMELHYARENYFINENQILLASRKINTIPSVIIHARYDLVCPIEASFQLQQSLSQAELIVLANAGHIAKGDEMIDALVTATDKISEVL